MGEDMLIEVGERGIVRIDKWQWEDGMERREALPRFGKSS